MNSLPFVHTLISRVFLICARPVSGDFIGNGIYEILPRILGYQVKGHGGVINTEVLPGVR